MNEVRCSVSADPVQLIFMIFRAAQRIESRIEASLSEVGLSLPKLGVLDHLVQAGEALPLGQLAGRLCCVKSNMTQLVDRLEADGLVARVADPGDRRSVRASLTDEGRRRHALGAQILAGQEQELFREFSAEERAHLTGFLRQLGGE
jgi:DNA-binding MarR family transcriptional regulator